MVHPATAGLLTMGESRDGEFMKAKIRQVVFELLAFLCLFLAIGAEWSLWERNQMPNSTVFEHFKITSEYSSYIPPEVAERAVDQAIEAAERRESRDQTPRAKIRVGVMGEKYTVENLQFDGFLSWKRKPIDVEAFVLEKAREIHRLALEVGIRKLAMVNTDFNPRSNCFSCSVWPVNTESFSQSFSVRVFVDNVAEYPELDSTKEELESLAAAEQFLVGLLEENKPFMVEAAAA